MRAGFAEIVITPCGGRCFLAGYAGPWSTGVHDDLYASAVCLEDQDARVLLISFDLIGMEGHLIADLKTRVNQVLGIERDSIFFTCTHTHEGPEVRRRAASAMDVELDYLDQYERFLQDRVVTVAREAVSQTRECVVRVNRAFVDENLNRRYFMPDGEYFSVPGHKDLAAITNQYEDKELGIISFCPPGDQHPFGIIINYTMHPLTAGHTTSLISADVPGVVRQVIKDGLSCLTCYITGAAGDNHPKASEGGFAEAERVGRLLATQAITRWYDSYALPEPVKLKSLTRSVTLRWRTLEELRLIAGASDLGELELESCLGRVPAPGKEVGVEFSLLAIGPVLFVGVPGEMVSELGQTLKWYSPFQRTYIMYQATESFDYIAHPNAYQWGGFETVTGQLSPTSVRPLMDAIIDAMEELA